METAQQLTKTLKREELFELVWKVPATKLADQYKIPYPDFKKICDHAAVPIPGSGYWSKLRAGKPVPNPVLPQNYVGPKEVNIEPRETLKRPLPSTALTKDLKSGNEKILKVPAKLSDPDKLILAAKEDLEKDKPGIFDGLVHTFSGKISIKVAPKNVSRALRIMDTLIKGLKVKGYSVIVNHAITYAIVEEQNIEISLREKLTRTMVKGTHWDSATYSPSGLLIFKMDRSGAKEWKDGKLKLEEYLPDILGKLEQKGKEERERRIRWQKEEEERQERDRTQREYEARQEKELTRFKILLQEAKRWKEVKVLREYIADMKEQATIKTTNPEAHDAWLQWAEQKADWYDPQVNARDELLHAVDKETLTLKKKFGLFGW